jgi:hypothetical protein
MFIALIAISTSSAADKSKFTKNQICKAGIAKIMGRDPAIIKIDRTSGETIYLSYIRQDDKTKWKYKCKLNGNQIIWGSDTGRWRTHAMDSKVHYRINGSSITVTDTFSDGSSSKEIYTVESIGN